MCMMARSRQLLTAASLVDVVKAVLVALVSGAIILWTAVFWGALDPGSRLTLALTLTVSIAVVAYDVNRLRRAMRRVDVRSVLQRPALVVAFATLAIFLLGWAWVLFWPGQLGGHGFLLFAYIALCVAYSPLVLLLGLLIENGWLRYLLRGDRTAADGGARSE